MFDYSDNEEEKQNYVLKYKKTKTGLMVKLAGHRNFTGISDLPKERAKLDAKMHEQGLKAITKKKKLTNSVTAKGLLTSASAILLTGSSAILALNENLSRNQVYGISSLVIVGGAATIYSAYHLNRASKKAQEVEKLSYLYEHQADLNDPKKYPNAFANMPNSLNQKINIEGIKENNIDEYQLADLKGIMTNINTEKAFNFTYQKVKK